MAHIHIFQWESCIWVFSQVCRIKGLWSLTHTGTNQNVDCLPLPLVVADSSRAFRGLISVRGLGLANTGVESPKDLSLDGKKNYLGNVFYRGVAEHSYGNVKSSRNDFQKIWEQVQIWRMGLVQKGWYGRLWDAFTSRINYYSKQSINVVSEKKYNWSARLCK